MNIQTLNHWAENFLGFAWPMLWQSSLLIVVVFALDYLLARRVRAAIRHALWIVVLVKLLLPPALALPTGAAWWLWPSKPALTPIIKTETVTFDSTPLPDNFVPQAVPMPVPPPPKLSGLGWSMLASGIVSAGLLFSLLLNWLKVERKSRRALSSGGFAADLEDMQHLAGLRGPMRLKLVDDAISPAVYGLFRPVILLPRALAEKLSETQLRAVLLHEAMHLRRGDVWVNCAQTLLQIAYWWHPLLWLANARIRRLREEAVDDAVMLALRGDADAYAPTLLEVAKFAFRRPLASLGLVGILESRSALRQRVERLVDFRPPRRAGVTFLSLFGIFLFGAVTLPMGQAPAAMTVSGSADYHWPPSPQPSSRGGISVIGQPSWQASAPARPGLVRIEGRFFWMPVRDIKMLGYFPGQNAKTENCVANSFDWYGFNQRIQALNLKPSDMPRIQCVSGNAASLYIGNRTNWLKWKCTPYDAGDHIDLAFETEIARVSSAGETNRFETSGHTMIDDGGGIVLRIPDPGDAVSNLVLVFSFKTVKLAPAAMTEVSPAASQWSASPPPPSHATISTISQPVWQASAPFYSRTNILIQGRFFWVPSGEVETLFSGLQFHEGQGETAPNWTADPERFDTVNERLDSFKLKPFQRPRIEITGYRQGAEADFYVGNQTNWIDLDCTPSITDGQIELDMKAVVGSVSPLNETNRIEINGHATTDNNGGMIFSAPNPNDASSNLVLVISVKTMDAAAGRKDIYNKLNQIHLDAVSFQNLPLSEVIRMLHEQSLRRDPEHKGINFAFMPPNQVQEATINPATGLPETPPAATNTAPAEDIQINLNVKNVSLENVLDAICLVADHPIKYSIEDYGVVFSEKDPNAVQYEMRTFKIDTNTFLASLQERMPSYYNYPPKTGGLFWAQPVRGTNDIGDLTRQYFRKLGLNLDPPKTTFYNDRLGVLFVYATPEDLKVVERIVMELNDPRTRFKNVTRSSSEPERKRAADAWVRVGKEFYKGGDLDEAKRDFSKALDLYPDNFEAKYYLSLISDAKAASQTPWSAYSKPVPFVMAKPPANTSTGPLVSLDPSHLLVSASFNPSDLVTNYFYDISMPAFEAAVRKETGESDVILGFQEIAAKAGVDLSPPKQVSITNYRRFEGLCVVAAGKDLRTIGRILDDLHCVLPQIHIKARFIEVPKTYFDDEKNSIPTAVTNGGILTASQFFKFLHQLQSKKGPQELAEPEVTTIEGRQTQVRATVIQPIVTSFALGSSTSHLAPTVDPQTQQVETGPILDVMAKYLPDSYTIDLTTIPSIIKFYGYADTHGLPPQIETNSNGQKIEVPISIPVFAVGEVSDEARLYDGQTLVLLPNPKPEFHGGTGEKYRDRIVKSIQEAQKKEGDKQLIVLVTATFIDAAGNRIHSDADMAFAKNRVPQQPVIWDSNLPNFPNVPMVP